MVTLEEMFLPGGKKTRYYQMALLAVWYYQWEQTRDGDMTREEAWQLLTESVVNLFLFGWFAYLAISVWDVAAGSKTLF